MKNSLDLEKIYRTGNGTSTVFLSMYGWDGDNEMYIELEDKWGDVVRNFLNVENATKLRDFLTEQLNKL